MKLETLTVNPNGQKDRNQIVLKKDGIQFGPYMPLPKGRYRVEIRGENLSVLSFSCCYLAGKKTVKIEHLKSSPEQVSYCISLPERIENIEFVARNTSDQIAKLFSISLIPMED